MRSTRRRAPIAMLTVALLAAPSALLAAEAHAQAGAGLEDEARSLYQAGLTAYNNGRFERALEYFNDGYAASQRAAFLYNIGLTHERLFHLEEALAAYRGYLQGMPDGPNHALVQARIAQIERQIAERAEAGGGPATPPDNTEPPEDGAEPLDPEAVEAPEDPVEGEPVEGEPVEGEPVAEPSPSTGDDTLTAAGFGIAGAGLAIVIAGAVVGGLAMAEHQSLNESCAPSCSAEQTSGGETLALVADVLLFGGAAVALGGLIVGILGLTSGGGAEHAELRVLPALSPTHAGLMAQGSF